MINLADFQQLTYITFEISKIRKFTHGLPSQNFKKLT